MSVLTGVGILLLSMLIVAFLQLKAGIFLLFLHHASGKFSKHKISDLCLFFGLGVETLVVIVFLLLYLLLLFINVIFPNLNMQILDLATSGLMIAIGIVFPVVYYRKGRGTRLFISRSLANSIIECTKKVKSRSDAFAMGLTSGVPELLFSLPVIFVSVLKIMEFNINATGRAFIIILFALISVLPLFIMRVMFVHDHNMATIERSREKNKTFFRIIISVFYLLIASLLIMGVYY